MTRMNSFGVAKLGAKNTKYSQLLKVCLGIPTSPISPLDGCTGILLQCSSKTGFCILRIHLKELVWARKRTGLYTEGFLHSSVGKESACNAGDPSLTPGSGRSPGEGIGYPLQYSWASLVAQTVKNLLAMWETWVRSWVGKIPWRRERLPTPALVRGVAKRQTRLSHFHCILSWRWQLGSRVQLCGMKRDRYLWLGKPAWPISQLHMTFLLFSFFFIPVVIRN